MKNINVLIIASSDMNGVEDNHNFICSTPACIGPIVHNCHHLSSKTFSSIFFKVQTKYMLGLSATPERKDGLSKVIYWFLGPQIVNIKRTTDKPTIQFVVNDCSEYIPKLTRQGMPNIPGMITELTKESARNELIIESVVENLKESRKILILSHRREHCEKLLFLLQQKNINAGLYLGGMKTVNRNESTTKDVIIGTYQASGEGFDVPELDTLILATPKSDIEQAVGRILRQKNANDPLVIDIVDSFSVFRGQYYIRKKYYSSKDFLINY
jgi:superfamily II DNA or RNA helicase